MIILDVIQGEESWHSARAKYKRTASLASAMMGQHKNIKRTDALTYMSTGVSKEFSRWVQENLMDRGHTIEASAIHIAEGIIGKELYPVTAISDDEYMLASYDGLSMDEEDAWECKSWNESKAADVRSGKIPVEDVWQVVQQLAVGAKRCLYMITDGTEEKTVHICVHRGNVGVEIERLIDGWQQVDIELETYTPTTIEIKPQAEAIKALPSVFVQATGMVTASNLAEFKEAASTFIATIKTELVTDEDFANAEATVKFCKDAEANLEATKSGVLAQTTSIDDAIKTLDHIQAQLRDKRLLLDKLVKSEKDARKLAIVTKAANDYAAHIESLEAETKPIRLAVVRPDFGGSIKGMKKLAAMQEAVDTALRDSKFAASQVAKEAMARLAWFSDAAKGYEFLFPDLQQIIFI